LYHNFNQIQIILKQSVVACVLTARLQLQQICFVWFCTTIFTKFKAFTCGNAL